MNSNLILSIVIGYLLGSIPFTQVVAKGVKGIDLREVGSRNVGGRNLIRSVGVRWGLIGGILDGFKGIAAMIVAGALSISAPLSFYAGMAAVAGHNWPIWLRFRGGKGLATALGVVLWLIPAQALISLIVALIVLKFTRNILLTSLTSFTALFLGIKFMLPNSPYLWLAWGLFIVVLLASIPDVLHKLRTSGGVREYMRNPNKVYETEAKARKK
jgi:glycerol-3-phosphate acyltransferase PlsY